MKEKIKFFLIFTGSFFLCWQNSFATIRSNEVNKLLTERIDKKYNVGIVVATIDANGIQFYHAGRISKKQNADFVNQNTLFPIASITKVFTTLLLADEVQRGVFKLNDPAQKYFYKATLPQYEKQQITLEQLATHTSGLPSQFAKFKNDDPYFNFTPEKLYQFLNSYQLTRPPGKKYEYCDLGIGLLGDIISQQEGKRYEDLIKNKITDLLQMSHTAIILFPENKKVKIVGYNSEDVIATPYHFPILQSAGAIYSTASDLAKFVSANMGLTQSNLYPAMQLTHISYHSQGNPSLNLDYPGVEELDIGLGWNIDKNYHLVWKNGNMTGFSSFIGFNQKTKQGVVVLANTGNVIYTDNLGMHILNNKIKLLPLYQEVLLSSNILNRYTGKYLVSDGTYYTFEVEGNHLKVKHITGPHVSPYFNIYPRSKNQFFGRIANAIFIFIRDQKNIMGFTLVEEGKQLTAKRI